MQKFVSYLRVSTVKQGVSGLGLEAQREAVTRYLKANDGKLIRETQEVESGKRKDRPALAEALRLCRIHGATLVIAKLDRLARNVAFISNLMESGVEFVAVDLQQANRMTIHILASVAEGEAAMISARTKAALAAAKARGVLLGRRTTSLRELKVMGAKGTKVAAAARTEKAVKRHEDLRPIIEDIQQNMTEPPTLRNLAVALNQRGIPTARGGSWSAVQIQRTLRRLGSKRAISSRRSSPEG